MIFIIECILKRSPYNFDLKFRLIHFYEILECPDKRIEIFKTMDIKSIQLDTLGFLYLKPAI